MYKKWYRVVLVSFFLTFFSVAQGYAQERHIQGIHTIEGRIRDENGTPVYNAFVELYNSFNTLMDRTRSTGQGRFTFRRVPFGRYVVSVKPYSTNLREDVQDVEFKAETIPSAQVEFVEFRLKVDRRFTSTRPQLTGTVYAQEVPAEAKRKFDSGMDRLRARDQRGVTDLEDAIQLFPTYFDALSALGKEYVALGKYEEGYKMLLRAIDVYQRCGDCYYSLGVAFYKLGEIQAGLKASNAAAVIDPGAPEVHLLNGILQRLNNENENAERSLLKAESLFKTPNPEVSWQLSLLYNKMSKNDQAADRLEQYLRESPDLEKKQKESVKKLIEKLRSDK